MLLLGAPAKAQYDETNNLFYHAIRTPQTNLLNPALFPGRNSFYLALPGMDLQFGSPLAINDLLRYDPATERTTIYVDSLLQKLSQDNKLRLGFDLQVLGFGLKIKRLFLDANVRLRTSLSVGLPISLFNELVEGNIDNNGETRQMNFLNGDLLNTQSYLETSVGAGWNFEQWNLTAGVHAKMLSGIWNMQTDRTSISLKTAPDKEEMTASIYYEMQGSAIVPYDTAKGLIMDSLTDVNNILHSLLGNNGFALDLGLKYELGPLTLSFSVLDLSPGIHWRKNPFSLSPVTDTALVLHIKGADVNTFIDNGDFTTENFVDELKDRLDSLKLTYRTGDNLDYWYSLPTKINVGASLSLSTMLRVGLLFHGQFDRGLISKSNPVEGYTAAYTNTFRWNTTLSASVNLFNWIELIAGTSIVYDGKHMDLFNPGAGISIAIGTFFQTYLIGDYTSNIRLVEAKAFNAKFGVNLLIGRGGKKKKIVKEYIPVEPLPAVDNDGDRPAIEEE